MARTPLLLGDTFAIAATNNRAGKFVCLFDCPVRDEVAGPPDPDRRVESHDPGFVGGLSPSLIHDPTNPPEMSMPDLTMTLEESFRRGVYPYSIGGVKGLVDPLKAFNRMYVAVPDFDALVEKFFAPPPEGEDPTAANARGLELMDTAIALEPAVLAGFKLAPPGRRRIGGVDQRGD